MALVKRALAVVPIVLLVISAGCIQGDNGKTKSTTTPVESTKPSPTNNTTAPTPSPTVNTTTPTPTTNSTSSNTTANTTAVYYQDDAESASKWVGEKKIQVQADPGQAATVTGVNHPTAGGWHASTKEKRSGTKSYAIQDEAKGGYHDDEFTAFVSPGIDLSKGKSAFLTFYIKGDTEANGADGLWWQIDAGAGFEDLGKQADSKDNNVKDWKEVKVDLAKYVGKKAVKLRLVFRSDISCSVDTDLPQGCGTHTSYAGFFVDDIRVAPA